MNLLDPLTNTVSTPTENSDQPPSECPACGALVNNLTRHTKWHEMFVPKQALPSGERTAQVRRLLGRAG
jgi:hypothetical protein